MTNGTYRTYRVIAALTSGRKNKSGFWPLSLEWRQLHLAFICTAMLSGFSAHLNALTVSNAVPASQVDPTGGATIVYNNPNFSTGFVNYCGETFAAKSFVNMTSASGDTILDFESASGFGPATQTLTSTGTAFATTSTLSPFNLTDALTSISTSTGTSMSIEYRTFDNTTNILSAPDATNGVFLVGDRGTNDTMVSGTQGLVTGEVWKSNEPGGAYFIFNKNLTDFGVVLNTNAGSTTDVIVLFDADGAMIGKYVMGIASGKPLYFGINSPTGIIRSVWVGQKYPGNGLVIDDLAFRAVLPPTNSLSYSFMNGAMSDWPASPGTTVTTSATGWNIQASNGDSKIYKGYVTINAGTYDMTGTGGGDLRVQIQSSWSATPCAYLNLSTSSASVPRTDHQRFTTTGGSFLLVARTMTNTGLGMIQSLSITPAIVTPYTPNTAQMAALRPVPSQIRGFMSEGIPTVGDHNTDAWWEQSFYPDATVWGAKVIRLYCLPEVYADNNAPAGTPPDFWATWPAFVQTVVTRVQEADAAHLKVVVDLHNMPFTGITDNADKWNNPSLNENMCRAWRDLATALKPYSDDGTIWGYDLLNEPLDFTQLPLPPRQWWPTATNVIRTIRTIDPNVWLIYEVGPGGYFSGFTGLRPLPDSRIIYSGHFYYPGAFTQQGVHDGASGIGTPYPTLLSGVLWNESQLEAQLVDTVNFQTKWQVPIYAGEFSTARWGPVPDTANYLRDVVNIFEDRGWSWTYCAFRCSSIWSLEDDATYSLPGNGITPTPVSWVANGQVVNITDRGHQVYNGLWGITPLEAETAATTPSLAPPMQVYSDATASGGQYIATPSGTTPNVPDTLTSPNAQYTFKIRTAGVYAVWARIQAADASSNSFYFALNPSQSSGYTLQSTTTYGSWVWVNLTSSANLSVGTNVLALKYAAANCKIDQIIVTANTTYLPYGTY